jgi:hypothetical protein
MTKHTPGPWKLVFSAFGNKMAVVGPENDGRITTSDRICNLPHRKRGEGEANGHLIAAAPDLLEALQAMVRSAHESPCGFPGIPLHRALAVIARATGGAP